MFHIIMEHNGHVSYKKYRLINATHMLRFSDTMYLALPQSFQSMTAQLLMKAALLLIS